jgi:hypothetical protein
LDKNKVSEETKAEIKILKRNLSNIKTVEERNNADKSNFYKINIEEQRQVTENNKEE